MSWVMRSPSLLAGGEILRERRVLGQRGEQLAQQQAGALDVASRVLDERRQGGVRASSEQAHPQRCARFDGSASDSSRVSSSFTTSSRVDHDFATSCGRRPRRRYGRGGLSRQREHPVCGRTGDQARRGPGARHRPRADAVGARVRAARRDGQPGRRDRHARRAVRDGLGRRAARRRSLGRRVREQAARQARGRRCPTAASSTPTPDSATASSRSPREAAGGDALADDVHEPRADGAVAIHEMFTSSTGRLESSRQHRSAGGCACSAVQKSSQRRSVNKNKIGALAGVARCSHSASPRAAAQQLHQLVRARPPQAARRRRSPAPARRSPPRSTSSGPRRSLGPDGQLPGRRLRRGHHLAGGQDRRLRRQRPAAEARQNSRRSKRSGPSSRSRCSWARSPSPTTCPASRAGLKLDGTTIADIYLGKIKTWNDPEIKALNPGVTLPSTPITVIHRSDSSGTTAGFTGFLAAVDPEFKSKVGEGKDVQWPTGTGAKGNAGVAGAVQQTHRRGRLRRAGLRAAAQIHLRVGQEQGGQLRRADARLDQRRCGRRRRCRRTSASKSQTPPRPRPTRSPRRRSSSSTRTCARRASPAANRPPRAS